jgi:hypothetical protein
MLPAASTAMLPVSGSSSELIANAVLVPSGANLKIVSAFKPLKNKFPPRSNAIPLAMLAVGRRGTVEAAAIRVIETPTKPVSR